MVQIGDAQFQVVIAIDSKVFSQYDYDNDAGGRRTSVKHSGSAFETGPAFNKYEYNSRSEVTVGDRFWGANLNDTSDPVAGQGFAYAYDNIGNRTASSRDNEEVSYTANSLNQYSQRTVADLIDYLGLLDCSKLRNEITNLREILQQLSQQLNQYYGSEQKQLISLFVLDRMKDTIFTLGGAAVGSSLNIIRVAIGTEVVQGESLLIDLIRAGQVVSENAVASGDFVYVAGGAAGGVVIELGTGAAAETMSHKAGSGTEGIRRMNEETSSSMNQHIQDLHDKISDKQESYNKCCR